MKGISRDTAVTLSIGGILGMPLGIYLGMASRQAYPQYWANYDAAVHDSIIQPIQDLPDIIGAIGQFGTFAVEDSLEKFVHLFDFWNGYWTAGLVVLSVLGLLSRLPGRRSTDVYFN